jgi:hypothetical protein
MPKNGVSMHGAGYNCHKGVCRVVCALAYTLSGLSVVLPLTVSLHVQLVLQGVLCYVSVKEVKCRG